MEISFVVVITTTDNREKAQWLTDKVLNERFAACAQIFEVESRYWWKGRIENANEYRIEFKTKFELIKGLIERIKTLHSYEVPEIIVLPIIEGEKNYLKWIEEENK